MAKPNYPATQQKAPSQAEMQAHQHYAEGIELHRKGHLGKAMAAYEQALRLVPNHFEALHHVGIIAFQGGKYNIAAGFIRSAIAINPNVASAYTNLGNALKELGRHEEALEIYDKACQIDAHDVDTLYNRGAALQALERYEAAVESYDAALSVNPTDAATHNNRGVALAQLMQYDAALRSYAAAIGCDPRYAEPHNNRGNVLRNLKRMGEALASYETAVALDGQYAEAHYNCGLALQAMERADAALACFTRAIELDPNRAEFYRSRATVAYKLGKLDDANRDCDVALSFGDDASSYQSRGKVMQDQKRYHESLEAYDRAISLGLENAALYNNRGTVLGELRQHSAALESFDKALTLEPDSAAGYCNRGNALRNLHQFELARKSYERALALRPRFVEAYNNHGTVQEDLREWNGALESYRKALALDADYPLAHWNKSLLHLRIGELRDGWPEYEWRWRVEGLSVFAEKRTFAEPLWLGQEGIAGKTILLYAEQGLGDTLQFCRYARLVAARGATVILEVQPPLVGLLGKLDGVSQVIARGSAIPPIDFQCPLMSLPHAFNTDLASIPAAARYLEPEPAKVARWSEVLGVKTKPRIGIVWSGSTAHRNDGNRSIAFAEFAHVLSSDCEFVSLQKEIRQHDQDILNTHVAVRQFSDRLDDFAETAALCDLMDLVITVDTSVAHLAGALGKPTWIMLPTGSDWRWMLDRSDSPWYPSVKLFRQATAGEWAPVLADIAAELDIFADQLELTSRSPLVIPATDVPAVRTAPSACPVCQHDTVIYDVVDFNKSCNEARGSYLPLSGRPIYYHRCPGCGFTYAPEFQGWSSQDFERHIYNDSYVEIDPDDVSARPARNASFLRSIFDDEKTRIRHLDYGGRSGSLSEILREGGWDSTRYDPCSGTSVGKFNFITAFGVFEHAVDVAKLMESLTMLMAPESIVIFSTLMSDGHLEQPGRINWWYASPRNGHISLFSKQSLIVLAEKKQLEFGSFSDDVHCFFNRLPEWAHKLLK